MRDLYIRFLTAGRRLHYPLFTDDPLLVSKATILTFFCRFQSHHIAACTRYIEYCLESGAKSPGHVLIVGAELSGKSTIACRLAGRLLKSPRTVFSICVECKHWKGKLLIIEYDRANSRCFCL